MQCPYCAGAVPDTAQKCQHCGEWLDAKRQRRQADDQKMMRFLLGLGIALVTYLITNVLIRGCLPLNAHP
jgi:predicted nucleic acid-binding Zn ribbon protein